MYFDSIILSIAYYNVFLGIWYLFLYFSNCVHYLSFFVLTIINHSPIWTEI